VSLVVPICIGNITQAVPRKVLFAFSSHRCMRLHAQQRSMSSDCSEAVLHNLHTCAEWFPATTPQILLHAWNVP
jgi:hypothetical protein